MKRIFCFLVVGFMLSLFMVPLFSAARVEAEGEVVNELVPINFNLNPGKYGILEDNVSPFAPFDYESEQRMAGSSFGFSQDEHRCFNGTINTDNDFSLKFGENYSLFMWLYFDGYVLHNLNIKLNFENGSYLMWDIDAAELLRLVEKYSNDGLSEEPHGWNLLELPFSLALKDGQLSDGENYQRVSGISIDYSSILFDDVSVRYSGLRFYHLYIKGQESQNISVNEKQSYIIYGFNDYDEKFKEGLYIGDYLTINSFVSVVKYAWMGETDLTRNGSFSSNNTESKYIWRVILSEPESTKTTRLYAGDKVDFSKEGVYTITYQCLSDSDERLISYSQQFVVSQLNPIYFSVNKVNAEIGKKYVVNVYASSAFSEKGDFTFQVDKEGIEVNYLGEGKLEIVANSPGTYSVTASIEASREINPEMKKYSVDFSVVVAKPKSDNKVLKIVLWSALGVFGVVLVVFVIKMLAEARHFDVK